LQNFGPDEAYDTLALIARVAWRNNGHWRNPIHINTPNSFRLYKRESKITDRPIAQFSAFLDSMFSASQTQHQYASRLWMQSVPGIRRPRQQPFWTIGCTRPLQTDTAVPDRPMARIEMAIKDLIFTIIPGHWIITVHPTVPDSS
jgi:hypothetical protein